jgi:hypothetical protein
MCCFSRPVELVSDTHIFARDGEKGRQYLVYEMMLKSKENLAMILPLPTPANSPEDAVKFISLKDYPTFFKDMAKGFLPPPSRGPAAGSLKANSAHDKKLEVVKVGNFEASFVPTVADFSRLDERFRLPEGTWDKLPEYAKYGFAVFKLQEGAQEVHPMAFSFPRADAKKLFLPTVHIHDGDVHKMADFDHALYCQAGGGHAAALYGWTESRQPAGMFLDKKKCGDLIAPDDHVYQRVMKGNFKNADVLV